MEYRIVENTDKIEFKEFIEFLLKDGFQLQGGVSAYTDSEGNIKYIQALTKY